MEELETLAGKEFSNKFINSLGSESMNIPDLLQSLDTDGDG